MFWLPHTVLLRKTRQLFVLCSMEIVLLLVCANYVPVYKVQCKKSTTALMDGDDAEMFTVLLLIYELSNHCLQAE